MGSSRTSGGERRDGTTVGGEGKVDPGEGEKGRVEVGGGDRIVAAGGGGVGGNDEQGLIGQDVDPHVGINPYAAVVADEDAVIAHEDQMYPLVPLEGVEEG